MVDPGNGSVCFGRGVEPNMNNIMCPIVISEFNYEVASISISTNGMNDGMWEFVSGEIFINIHLTISPTLIFQSTVDSRYLDFGYLE